MDTRLRDSAISLDRSSSFFNRYKLSSAARGECDGFAKSIFPDRSISPVVLQGYCSYTLRATPLNGCEDEDIIIQFRPKAHAVPIDIAAAACEVYGSLAPTTRQVGELLDLGLIAYSIAKIPGISLLELRETSRQQPPARTPLLSERIIKDFAKFQALTYHHHLSHSTTSTTSPKKGLIGTSLRHRLELMQAFLPKRFHPILTSLLGNLNTIESSLPWVLSHGDLLPANILIHPTSGELQGLIDWAEAEYLPFGVGMYGLEELLGQPEDKHEPQRSQHAQSQDGAFQYYPEAAHLRKLFWSELLLNCPELRRDSEQISLIKKAQVLGVFLWHGIAFDDGALNRACEVGRDDEEIAKLDAFLSTGPEALWRRKASGRRCGGAFSETLRILRRLSVR